jgi:hypothetical protein
MPRPAVGTQAEDLYDALEPLARGDEDRGWPLLRLCAALTAPLDGIDRYVGDRDDGTSGWTQLLNPWTAPAAALPFLAQFVGVTLEPQLSEHQQREKIAQPRNFARGTVAALRSEIELTLTGTRAVSIVERLGGNAYRLWIRTRDDETPSAARTIAAIEAHKPLGVMLVYEQIEGWAWDDVVAEHDDWADVRTGYGSWIDLRSHQAI